MRVGHIIKLIPDRKFGFIKTDHFREDVFFHFSSLRGGLEGRLLEENMEVEFEINEILRLDEQKLEATIVQTPARPLSKTLNEKFIRELQASHHPRARQRKPTWREKSGPKDESETESKPETTPPESEST